MTIIETNRTHGLSAYGAGCRCDVCKSARREKGRADRAKVAAADKSPTVHGASGYANYGCRCEVCVLAAQAYGREYRLGNAQLLRATKREHYLANRAHIAAQQKAWRMANGAAISAARRRRRAADPDDWTKRDRARGARYKRSHPERAKAASARRRGAESFKILPREWNRLCARYRNACHYCGEVRPLTRDHVIPLARGGRHSIGNLIPACGSCNSSKNDRLIIEWRAKRSV